MELELKYLAPYYPYNLRGRHITGDIMVINSLYVRYGDNDEFKTKYPIFGTGSGGIVNCGYRDFKPFLRPLGTLLDRIEIEGKSFIPLTELESYGNMDLIGILSKIKTVDEVMSLPYWIIEKLFEWHFDVFGLIPMGLALEIKS